MGGWMDRWNGVERKTIWYSGWCLSLPRNSNHVPKRWLEHVLPGICGNASWAAQTLCSGISNLLNKTSMTNNHSLENVAIGGQPLPCFLGTHQILWHINSSHRTTQKKPRGEGFSKEVKALSLDHMALSNLTSPWVSRMERSLLE